MTRWIGLALLVLAAGGGAPPDRFRLEGACYCRAAGRLDCLGVFTERECERRCIEALCDESFWLERRPCWNWGYGG